MKTLRVIGLVGVFVLQAMHQNASEDSFVEALKVAFIDSRFKEELGRCVSAFSLFSSCSTPDTYQAAHNSYKALLKISEEYGQEGCNHTKKMLQEYIEKPLEEYWKLKKNTFVSLDVCKKSCNGECLKDVKKSLLTYIIYHRTDFPQLFIYKEDCNRKCPCFTLYKFILDSYTDSHVAEVKQGLGYTLTHNNNKN